MVVRAVQVHEPVADAFERLECGRGVVDETFAGAVGGELTADDELIGGVVFQAEFIERVAGGGAGIELEHGLDGAKVGAGAQDGFVSALAEQEVERAGDDGFAGAGFAGDDVEAGPELDEEVVHDGQVANPQGLKHGREDNRLGAYRQRV